MARWFTRTVILTVLCVATTILTDRLSASDAVIAPVWPLVGIAFSALLLYGRALWPGVWLSVFLITIGKGIGTVAFEGTYPSWLSAAGVATLYTLQAVGGVWLYRKVATDPVRLMRLKDVFCLLLIAGPLHTLFASTLFAGISGQYPNLGGDRLTHGLSLWIRDSAGGLIFAPITLTLFAQPQELWRQRFVTVSIPLLIALGLTLMVHRHNSETTQREVWLQTQTELDTKAKLLELDAKRVLTGMETIRDMQAPGSLSHPTARRIIGNDLRSVRRSTAGMSMIAIDLIIPDKRRNTFERTTRQAVRSTLASFYISDLRADGQPEPAPKRPVHIVRYHLDSQDANDFSLGRDYSLDPLWELSYERALRTGQPVVFSKPDQPTNLLFFVLPIYTPPKFAGPPAPYGFVVAAFDPAQWLQQVEESQDPHTKFSFVPPGVLKEPQKPNRDSSLVKEVPLVDPKQTLTIRSESEPTRKAIAPNLTGGLTSLVLVALLASLVLGLTGRTASANREVLDRTVELEQEVVARELTDASRLANATRLEDAQRITHVGYWEWDPVADEAFWSPELTALLGQAPDDPTGKDLVNRLHPEDRSTFDAIIRARLVHPEPAHAEVRVMRPNGEARWIAATITRGDGVAGYVIRGTFQDITERKRAEAERQRFNENLQQTQRLESLGLLASGVAHDFNNLLTGILGNINLARGQVENESDLHEFLRPAEKSAEHAAQLCRHLLAYAGKGKSCRGIVDLNKVIEDSKDLLGLAATRRAQLVSELGKDLYPLEGDAGQIRQILLNLVQNASEALGLNGGRIVIRTGFGSNISERPPQARWSGDPPAGYHVWLEVSDTGAGMDEKTVARIFDPFFTTKFTGRGLGLSAVSGIVTDHGGAIRVISAPGHGTSFRVYFPALTATIPTASELEVPTPLPQPAAAVLRTALVADDDPVIRQLVILSLKSLGFTIIEAQDGLDAVELFRNAPDRYSVVMLDLMMPGLDGRNALAEIRMLNEDVPVILISGYTEADVADLDLGTTVHFLQKPFRPIDLTSLIRRVLVRQAPA